MPMAIILLSCGWNAKNVAAGGGGMNVVIVCICKHQMTIKANFREKEKLQSRKYFHLAILKNKPEICIIPCTSNELRC